MKNIIKSFLLLIVLSVTVSSNTVTQNIIFTDSKTGRTYNLYNLLDAGFYVLFHASWTDEAFSAGSFPGNNFLYSDYGENEKTLLMFEICINNTSGYVDWCNTTNGGVDYGVVTWENGGESFKNATSAAVSNESFLFRPNYTYDSNFGAISLVNEQYISKTENLSNIVMLTPKSNSTFYSNKNNLIGYTLTYDLTPLKIEYSMGSAGSWTEIVSEETNPEFHSWQVGDIVSDSCRLRITSKKDTNESVMNNGYFSIKRGVLELRAQLAGRTFYQGDRVEIKWWERGDVGTVKLEYSLGDTNNFQLIENSVSNDTMYSWVVPYINSNSTMIRITSNNHNNISVKSGTFSVVNSINISYPEGPDTLYKGEDELIRWTSLKDLGTLRLEYSKDSCKSWNPIAIEVTDTGSYTWRVPEGNSDYCKVKVISNNDENIFNESNRFFAMKPGLIVVDAPNGQEVWYKGQRRNIEWNTRGEIGTVKLEYSLDNGTLWHLIESSTGNDGVFEWTLPDTVSENCRIKVTSNYYNTVLDESNNKFSIRNPSITLTAPTVGEVWQGYEYRDVTWNSTGISGNISISYSIGDSTSWVLESSEIPNDGVFTWRVPNIASDKCYLKVSSSKYPSISNKNSVPFIIQKSSLNLADITANPISDTVFVNDSAKFTVTALGEAPLTYQWQKNQVDLVGETSSELIIENVEYSDSGNYRCIVKNNFSSDTSFSAKLTVVGEGIKILSPNGGEFFSQNSNMQINWNSNLSSYQVAIDYSIDNGFSWVSIIDATEDDGEYSWLINCDTSSSCLIKISSVQNSAVFDISDNVFSIDYQTDISEMDYDLNKVKKLSAAPNPLSILDYEVMILPPDNLRGHGVLAVFDLMGNVLDKQIVALTGEKCFRWDLRNSNGVKVGTGTYMAVLTVKRDDGTVYCDKIRIGVKK